MHTVGKRLPGVLLLALVAAVLAGCGGTSTGLRQDRPDRGVSAADENSVAERGDVVAEGKGGGDQGLVLANPRY